MINKNYVFRIVIAILLVITLTVSVISCKEAVVEEQQEEEKGQEAIPSETTPKETKEETPPTEEETSVETALETILKEKVSFISEVLPGTELNTKTGELTAKAGNEWGVKEGENIGWYVVGAYKEKNADGLETEKDAIGLIPLIIEFMQNKIFEETEEYTLPLPIDFKESPGAKITELKITNPDFLSSATVLGFNVLPGAKVIAPIGGEWSSTSQDAYTKGETEDKTFFIYYTIDESNDCYYSVFFRNAEVLPKIKNTYRVDNSETGKEIVTYTHDVIVGEPFLNVTGDNFLDSAANKLADRIWFEQPGDYQLVIVTNLIKMGTGNNGKESNIESKPINILKVGQDEEQKMVFILSNSQKPANEEVPNYSKELNLGLSGLLKIEDILVFISPANE